MEKETPSIRQRLELLKLKVDEIDWTGAESGHVLVDKLHEMVDSLVELIGILIDEKDGVDDDDDGPNSLDLIKGDQL